MILRFAGAPKLLVAETRCFRLYFRKWAYIYREWLWGVREQIYLCECIHEWLRSLCDCADVLIKSQTDVNVFSETAPKSLLTVVLFN